MDNGQATDGICICGYGYEQMRVSNWGELYSKEHPHYVDPDDEAEVSWEPDRVANLASSPTFDELWKREREIFETNFGCCDVCDMPPLTTAELNKLGRVRCVTPRIYHEGKYGNVLGWIRDGFVVLDWPENQ